MEADPEHFHSPGLVTWSGLPAMSTKAREAYVTKELEFRRQIAHLRDDPEVSRLWVPTAAHYRKMDTNTRPMHPMVAHLMHDAWRSSEKKM